MADFEKTHGYISLSEEPLLPKVSLREGDPDLGQDGKI
jgi:hypothetical protein